jgi:multiple sugar transport system substrate-binding protein
VLSVRKKQLLSFILCVAFAQPAALLPAEQIAFLYMKQSGYDLGDIVERAESFRQKTGIRVNPVFVEYEDRYNLILQSAARTIPDLDLILVDLIWVADFADKGIIDPLPPALEARVRSGTVPQIYSAFGWSDRLWAIPFHIDFQMLYTNVDDMRRVGAAAAPATLEGLVRLARKAKAAGVVKYPIFEPWRRQEVLTCELTWLVGAFGGSLVDETGRVDCDSPAALRALTFMVDLLDQDLANPYSLDSEENFASEVFLAGDCMFTTNWSFLIRLLAKNDQPGIQDWKVSPIPVAQSVFRDGKRTSSICGFEGLGVLSKSAHKNAAWAFAQYLDSPEFQTRHLEFMPAWKEVWDSEKAHREDPFLSIKQLQITGLQYRPVHPRYRQISEILQHWVSQALHGQVTPAEALREAQTQINRVTGASP